MAASTTTLAFTVTRQTPELVVPAKPTPHEHKLLSDIDDQRGLRFPISVIMFYRNNPSAARGRDPVKVIREAMAKALVFYYPLAGRLREAPGGKLMVECTGEGVMCIEADADVTLDQLGDPFLLPPFPCLEELLYDVPGSVGILDCTLMLFQVTRLRCGGFILALRTSHTVIDGPGLIQFMVAVGEIARGASSPSVLPVWQRDLLFARNPPRVTFTHHEHDDLPPNAQGILSPLEDFSRRSFFFGTKQISAVRQLVPPHLRNCSLFDVLTASLWRCRTIALDPHPDEEVRVIFVVSARGQFKPPLPAGYYGNVFASPVAISTAGKLCRNPLGYALELVMKAKGEVTEEYMRSLADLMVVRGRPPLMAASTTYLVSDVVRLEGRGVDFGWGEAVYAGPAEGGLPGMTSFYLPFANKKGERGIVVSLSLPAQAMERFVTEIDAMLKPTIIASAL